MTDTPIGYFLQGHASAEAGQPETANPMLFDAWPYQAWLAGHRFYGEYASARVLQHDGPLERVDVTPHEQGRIAYGKGRPLEACPYEPESQDWKNWRIGWRERQLEAKWSKQAQNMDNARRLGCICYFVVMLVIVGGSIVWAFSAH